MKGIILLAALSLPCAATAQNVIVKCIDAKGAVIYQTDPCDSKQKMVSYKAYDAIRDDPRAIRKVAEAQREVDARRATYGRQAVGTVIPADSNSSACASAKAHREATLKAVGMRRNYDLLQRLDENVRRACR